MRPAAVMRSAEEVAKAKHIIDEYEKADLQKGLGAIVIDDQLVDAAVLRVEWRKLAIARKAGLA
jgi:citrate lyase subunit beta / citryl-CoA lyase